MIDKLPSGNYRARVMVKGKLYAKTFSSKDEATKWAIYLKKNKAVLTSSGEILNATNHAKNAYNDISGFFYGNGKIKSRKVLDEICEIDNMSGTVFEDYCIQLLDLSGLLPYALYAKTKTSGDYGADIIITTAYGLKVSVQCKRLKSSPVRVDAVQEVVASKKFYHTKECMIMTNSKLTPNALALAEMNKVLVIDRDGLEKLIRIKNDNLKPIDQKTQWKEFSRLMLE